MTPRRRQRSRGFTLVEALSAVLLAGLVLPAILRCVVVCLDVAQRARDQAQAVTLAEAKLQEVVTAAGAFGVGQGDFGAEWPRYRWTLQTATRNYGLTQLDLQVHWTASDREQTVTLTTLVGDSSSSTDSSTSTSSGGMP